MRIGPFSYDFASLPTIGLRALRDARLRQRIIEGAGVSSSRPSRVLAAMALQAKITMDRAVCALRFGLSPSLSNDEWLRIVEEVTRARRLWDACDWIDRPQRYHVSPPALQAPALHRERSRGVDFQDLSFESGYEPHREEPGYDRWLGYRANRTAHAWVLRHDRRPRPWLVCIHGYSVGIPFLDFQTFPVAWLHEELGLNLVMPVLPLHGPRKIGWQSGDGFFTGDILDMIHAEAQAVWDLRRILSWVRLQQPTAVGVYGLSLGGYNAALLAALDPDLACVIAGIPASDFVRLGQLHTRPATLKLAEQAGLNWDEVGRLLRVVSPLALPSRVPHRRRYLFGGVADCIVPPDQVRDLWQHWNRPRIAWYDGSHLSFPWESPVTALLQEALGAAFGPPDEEPQRAVA